MNYQPQNRIRKLREINKLSGTKLATMLEISPQYLYGLEKGERRLNEELIIQLAQIFGVTTDYLLGFSDYPYLPNTIDETRGKSEPIIDLEGILMKDNVILDGEFLDKNTREGIIHFARLVRKVSSEKNRDS